MLARWRVLALLTLLITVVWSVRPVSAETTRADERMSEAGEIGTLPARRADGSPFVEDADDDGPAHPPRREQTLGETVRDADAMVVRPAVGRSVARVGSTSPRGPPSLV